jgi:hypothetical protein
MKINYVLTPSGNKLFSFKRHDYRIEEGVYIDGGFDYTRSNVQVHQDDIHNLIGDIREQFMWGKNYDKDNQLLMQTEYSLLKDLTTEHIVGILIYFTNRLTYGSTINSYWKAYHLIFLNELKYRYENKLV